MTDNDGGATPRPWVADPDWREGYSWNIHILDAANPEMRICFMTSDGPAQANADLIVEAVNNYDAAQARIRELEAALQKIAARVPKKSPAHLRIICPVCNYKSVEPHTEARHAPNCAGELARAALTSITSAVAPREREPVVPVDAIVNLVNHQVQCDMDGVMIQVSRQALCEVLAYVTEIRPDNKWADQSHTRPDGQ